MLFDSAEFKPHDAIGRMWTYGYKASELERIFNSIPSELASHMQKAFLALQTMYRMQALNSRRQLECGECLHRLDESDTICKIPEELEASRVYGVLQFSYDPKTNTRKQVAMNARYAELHGYHHEELLSRFANHDLYMQPTAIDSAVLLLDSLQVHEHYHGLEL